MQRWPQLRAARRWARACVYVTLCAAAVRAETPPDGEPQRGAVSGDRLDELLDTEGPVDNAGPVRLFGLQDLAPYFTEAVLGAAKAEFDKRRYPRARALLRRAGDSTPVRYLRALSAFYAGNDRVAAGELEALASDYPAMRDYCLLDAGKAMERQRKFDKAIDLYSAVTPGSLPFPEARFGLARVLKRAARYTEAIDALAPLRELPAGVGSEVTRLKALLATCDLARWNKDYGAEHRALLEVWASAPSSPQAEVAWERLEQLPLPGKWKVRRAEAFLAMQQNLKAFDVAESALRANPIPSEIGCRAGFAMGNALRKERQHRKAIAALTPVVEQCPIANLRPQALFVMGYSQSVVSPEACTSTYEMLARDYPQHRLADDALYFAAEEHQRHGDKQTALRLLTDVISRYPSGNFAADAVFKTAWIYRQGGDQLAALKALESMPSIQGAGLEQDLLRARYWRGRVLAEAGSVPQAHSVFRELASSQPATYYGSLARERLAELRGERLEIAPAIGSPCTPPAPWPVQMGPLATNPHFVAGVELYRLGLKGASQELLAAHRRGQSEESARLLYQIMQEAGDERAARVVARTGLAPQLEGAVGLSARELWEVKFPLSFRSTIERSARKARVDPDLVQALIREESRFRPSARSSTGALGLMQLMPQTAEKVARQLGVTSFYEQQLLQPSLNIRLGATYLTTLLRQFDGTAAHAVAAYNAGPRAVGRWLEARPDAPLDEWVEEIPFEETRHYVKRVLGSYEAYQLVYRRPAPSANKTVTLAEAPIRTPPYAPVVGGCTGTGDAPSPSQAAR